MSWKVWIQCCSDEYQKNIPDMLNILSKKTDRTIVEYQWVKSRGSISWYSTVFVASLWWRQLYLLLITAAGCAAGPGELEPRTMMRHCRGGRLAALRENQSNSPYCTGHRPHLHSDVMPPWCVSPPPPPTHPPPPPPPPPSPPPCGAPADIAPHLPAGWFPVTAGLPVMRYRWVWEGR